MHIWHKGNKYLFYGLSLLGFIVSFILVIQTDGEALRSFFYYGHDYFMDFFNHIYYVSDRLHLYESSIHASFPPLAYVLYFFLGKGIPDSAIEGTGNRAVRDNLFGLNLYVVYMVVLAMVLVFLIQFFLKNKSRAEQLLLSLIVLVSAPFVGLYERGNSAFIVLLLLLLFIALKDSSKSWQREAALILLAVAAGLKLYPAVFGLLYLQERRWKETARLVLYGLLFTFGPFVFFGGFKELPVLLYNLRAISEQISFGDLRSVVYAVVLIGEKFEIAIPVLLKWGRVIAVLFFCSACLCTFFQKCLWKKMVLLSGIMIFFPTWSGSYTLVYLVLPLLLFIGEGKNERTGATGVCIEMRKSDSGRYLNLLYEVFFAWVFTMMLWNLEWSKEVFNSDFPYTIRALGAWGLVITVMVETIVTTAHRYICVPENI